MVFFDGFCIVGTSMSHEIVSIFPISRIWIVDHHLTTSITTWFRFESKTSLPIWETTVLMDECALRDLHLSTLILNKSTTPKTLVHTE